MLIKRPPVAPDIRIQSARRILVSAAALFASASCSVDAPSADERSIGNSFPTEPEVVVFPVVHGRSCVFWTCWCHVGDAGDAKDASLLRRSLAFTQ